MYPDRRSYDPDPIGRSWETAVAVIVIAATIVVLAALAGQGLAALLSGGGWVWPNSRSDVAHALGGLITGRPGEGLGRADAAKLPGVAAVYSGVAFAELFAVAFLVICSVAWAGYRRPHDARRGMATRTETTRTLGPAELRRARRIVRPDLDEPR